MKAIQEMFFDEQMKLARQNTQLKKQKFLKQNKIKR
jgi:hypothetical protein|tara:strand:+ start:1265 stop:1372 length:108 start_codon:yes stop_codon:yes gene_type:complete